MKDYDRARDMGLIYRAGEGAIPHRPETKRLMEFLAELDFQEYDDYFCWKVGGEGDNGEIMMCQLDTYFEYLERITNGQKD